jgi:hypothetical protein
MNPYSAVRRGARFLDRELPRWAEIIDPSLLMMNDCYRCVLGQLFRNFDAGLCNQSVHPAERVVWLRDWHSSLTVHERCYDVYQAVAVVSHETDG